MISDATLRDGRDPPLPISISARLVAILAFIEGHLRFAEAKNSALLAANGVVVAATIAILTGTAAHNVYAVAYLSMFLFFSTLSAIIILVSFLPRTEVPWLHNRGHREDNDDLMFFGDIRKYRPEEYLAAIAKKLGASCNIDYFDRCYARQIIINSRIASYKFTLFRYAIWLTVCGVTSPIGAFALYKFLCRIETF